MSTRLRTGGTVMRGVSLFIGVLVLSGCGVSIPPSRPALAPDLMELPALPAADVERLDNGLSIVRLPAARGVFRAALLLATGPADDPADGAGLTELAIEMALEGTTTHPDQAPRARARALGGEISVVGDGSVSGWFVQGADDVAMGLTTLLVDVLTAPEFPATRIQSVTQRARETAEVRDNAIIMSAIAVAAGIALGRPKPLRVQATPHQLGRLNRETIVRHWAGMVVPRRAALVVSGDPPTMQSVMAAASKRLARLKPNRSDAPPATAAPCQPSRESTHLVMNPGSGLEHVFNLIALPVPGRGAPGRKLMEAALAALATTPTGLVAKALDPDRAFHARPRLLDLGYGDGEGAAILLMRVSGPRLQGMKDLFKMLTLLNGVARKGLPEDALRAGYRGAASERAHQREGRVGGLLLAASEALYRPKPMVASANKAQGLGDIFDPSSRVVVSVGPVELVPLLKRIAPLSVWNSVGRFAGGRPPPSCKQQRR